MFFLSFVQRFPATTWRRGQIRLTRGQTKVTIVSNEDKTWSEVNLQTSFGKGMRQAEISEEKRLFSLK